MRADKIEMVPYDSSWVERFAERAEHLAAVLDGSLVRDIEHIGSTAVPGLCAKPIIDMLAVVDDVDAVRDLTAELAAISWVRDPEPRDLPEERLSFCFPSRERRTHHLHVVLDRHPGWRGWIAFRDRLRRDDELLEEYARLKRSLASRFGDDPNERDRYRSGKAELIAEITAEELRSPT